MDIAAILALVSKGVSVANALIEAGQNAGPAITALMNLLKGNQKEITQADLDKCEAVLDALLDEFQIPLPPEDA